MKKIVLGLSILLLAAGCAKQTAMPEQAKPVSTKTSDGVYIVTAGIKYVNDHPVETHLSVLGSDGSLIKTLPIPEGFVTGAADNIKVFGDKIYYRKGSSLGTAGIGTIDIKTGAASVLGGTKNNPFDKIPYFTAWSVSSDHSKIAWADGDNIMVANSNGSDVRTYKSGPTRLGIYFVKNYIYFEQGDHTALQRININDGSASVVLDQDKSLDPNSYYEISHSNKYLAYESQPNTSPDGQTSRLVIKNLSTSISCSVPYQDTIASIYFSPDETQLALSRSTDPSSDYQQVDIYNPKNCDLISSFKNYGLINFLSDSSVLAMSPLGSVVKIDLTTKKITQISNELFEGITL